MGGFEADATADALALLKGPQIANGDIYLLLFYHSFEVQGNKIELIAHPAE